MRTKNASVICLKNIGLYSIAGLAYYFLGYNLMYVDVTGWIGSFQFLYGPSADELALLGRERGGEGGRRGQRVLGDVGLVLPDGVRGDRRIHRVRHAGRAGEAVVVLRLHHGADRRHLSHHRRLDVGRRLAERDGLPGLRRLHHSSTPPAAWAALPAAIVAGARRGKFREDGTVKSTPPSNVPAVTLGVFILWLGWFGFHGGSQLALGGAVGRGRHEQRARQHQPRGGRRGHGRDLDGAADSWDASICWPD